MLLATDSYTDKLQPARNYANQLLTPIYELANNIVYYPARLYADVLYYHEINEQLNREAMELRARLNAVDSILVENTYLRKLLDINQARQQKPFIIVEVTGTAADIFTHEVIINKGYRDGVTQGSSLMDAYGIVGQVIETHPTTSRVLLISDERHAIPVRVNRNNLNLILKGISNFNKMVIHNLPDTMDIKTGDLLTSSGMGNRFPPGYKVAEVVAVEKLEDQGLINLIAKPFARLDRLGYLLLVPSAK